MSAEYTRLVEELGIVGIPLCDPPALGKLIVERIQRGDRAQMAAQTALSNLEQFRYDYPFESNNPQVYTALEHLRRTNPQ